MTDSLPNFRAQFFPNKELPKIHGTPTFSSLQELFNQAKSNASSVPSTLGGGIHGHLGLLLSPIKYESISLVPFSRPVHPILDLTGVTSWEETQARRLLYNDARKLFSTVNAVETALKQQLTESIQSEFLKEFVHRHSRVMEDPIHTIFERLFTKYGKITVKDVIAAYNDIITYKYDISIPISDVFNLLEDYSEYAIASHRPLQPKTLMDLGYAILLDTHHFSTDLRSWKNKPETNKTWENFKTYFRQAHEELHEFATPTAADAGYAEHANIIAAQVAARLQESSLPTTQPSSYHSSSDSFVPTLIETINSMQSQIDNLTVSSSPAASTTSSVTNSLAPGIQLPPVPTYQPPPIPNYAMYAAMQPPQGFTQHPNTFNNSGPPNMGGYGQQIQPRGKRSKNRRNQQNMQVFSMPNPIPGFPPQYNYYTQPGQNFHPNFNPQNLYQPPVCQNVPPVTQNATNLRPPNQRFYCWTHGLCNHLGTACRNPADGHQAQATLENRMNGSNKNM